MKERDLSQGYKQKGIDSTEMSVHYKWSFEGSKHNL